MKRLRRKREIAVRDLANWSEVREYIAAQFDKMVALYRQQYGHLFTATWWYESEWCPCCQRQRVGVWTDRSGQPNLSLNGFMYTERRVLIGYLLCRSCVEALVRAGPQRYAELHRQIEACLIGAYEQAAKAGSVSDGVD